MIGTQRLGARPMTFSRADTSRLATWWWTVDRWTLAALGALIFVGAVLILAASPSVASRIGADAFHFVRRQFVFLPVAMAVMIGVSLLGVKEIRRLAVVVLGVSAVLMALTLVVGVEIKGATRWISLAGFSIQPSEFAKPAFAVVAAWMFAEQKLQSDFPGYVVATALYGVIVGLLLLQPDVGMSVVMTMIWAVEFFLAGMPMIFVVAMAAIAVSGGVGAYFLFPHVQSRIDRFLNPESGDSYQVSRGLEAFNNGGLLGLGPGEGRIKNLIPDAHADFIFAVAGEEFGLFACLLIVGLFAFIVLRGFSRMLQEHNLFVVLATAGLLVQFGLQAMINMASTLHLMPTKGMTLPFISYGGSSLVALAFGMGMVLALTRRRFGDLS